MKSNPTVKGHFTRPILCKEYGWVSTAMLPIANFPFFQINRLFIYSAEYNNIEWKFRIKNSF